MSISTPIWNKPISRRILHCWRGTGIADPVDMDYDLPVAGGDVCAVMRQFAASTALSGRGKSRRGRMAYHLSAGRYPSRRRLWADDAFMLVRMQRAAASIPAAMDDDPQLDNALTGGVGSGRQTVWSGLDPPSRPIRRALLRSACHSPLTADDGGRCTLAAAADALVEVGLPWTHLVEPSPPSRLASLAWA